MGRRRWNEPVSRELVLPPWCSRCHKSALWGREHRLVKFKDYCLSCLAKEEKPYEMVRIGDSPSNACGGCTLYKVNLKPKPKDVDNIQNGKARPMRLHCVVHHEFELGEDPKVRRERLEWDRKWEPVSRWSEVWKQASGWHDAAWESRHKGDLKRGISKHDGNGIRAIVEDADGHIYVVHGVWG